MTSFSVPSEKRETGTRTPIGYSPETILTTEEVAAWLDVHPKTVRKLGIKTCHLGHSTVRYLAKHVLEYMDAKAA
jgi:hypothetical protein